MHSLQFAKSDLHIQHMVKKGALENAGASSAALRKLESAAKHLALEAPDSKLSDEEAVLHRRGRAVRGMPSSSDYSASLLVKHIDTVSGLEMEMHKALKQPAIE